MKQLCSTFFKYVIWYVRFKYKSDTNSDTNCNMALFIKTFYHFFPKQDHFCKPVSLSEIKIKKNGRESAIKPSTESLILLDSAN